MLIRDVGTSAGDGAARLSARIVFEDTARSTLDVYYEVDAPFADALVARADPFLLAAVPLAAWVGERRVRVEGRACSVLRENLAQILRVLGRWYERCRPPAIEASGGFVASRPLPVRRSGLMFSGGVDALAALRQNRLDVPLDHPDAIRDGIVVFGMNRYDFQDGVPVPARLAMHRVHLARLARFGERVDLTTIPVRTNVHLLHEDYAGWVDAGSAAGLVSAAHVLGGRLTDVFLGSGGAGFGLPPHSFHPLLDDRHSSGALHVRSAQPYSTRYEKVGLLSTWEAAWSVLNSCHHQEVVEEGKINCGRCEKCVRTMLAFVAWGALDKVTAYEGDDVTPAMVRSIRLRPLLAPLYTEDLLAGLAAQGRHDLAAAVRQIVQRTHETWWQRRVRKARRSVAKRLGRRGSGGA